MSSSSPSSPPEIKEYNFDFDPTTFNTSIFSCWEDPVSCLDATACTMCLICKLRSIHHSDMFPDTLKDLPARGCQSIFATFFVFPICLCSCIDRHGVMEKYNMTNKSSPVEKCVGCLCPCLSVAQSMRELVLRGESVRGLFFGRNRPRMLEPLCFSLCCCVTGKGNMKAAGVGEWSHEGKMREAYLFGKAPKIHRIVTSWETDESRERPRWPPVPTEEEQREMEEEAMRREFSDQNRMVYMPAARPFGAPMFD